MIHTRSSAKLSENLGNGKFVKLCNEHESIFFYMHLETDQMFMKINTRVPAATTNSIALDDHYSFLDR